MTIIHSTILGTPSIIDGPENRIRREQDDVTFLALPLVTHLHQSTGGLMDPSSQRTTSVSETFRRDLVDSLDH